MIWGARGTTKRWRVRDGGIRMMVNHGANVGGMHYLGACNEGIANLGEGRMSNPSA